MLRHFMTISPFKRLNLKIAFLLAAYAGALPVLADAEMKMTALSVPKHYQLVWADEFTTEGLPDAAKWRFDTGMNSKGWHNNEKQYYSDARLKNSRVCNGRLTITADREPLEQLADWGGQKYSSARMITAGKAEWVYGFFEVRAKLPCGRGTWPAIWMWGSSGEWPDAGELDILEQVGNNPERVFSTVHTRERHGNGLGDETRLKTACSDFHNYQMHWTKDSVRFGIDGKMHFEYKNAHRGVAQWPFDQPQFMILNIAIGGDLGGAVDDSIFPVAMEIDYVRVYQPKP